MKMQRRSFLKKATVGAGVDISGDKEKIKELIQWIESKYAQGTYEYKTTEFKHTVKAMDNFQGVAVVNYTDQEPPYTRIIEHKHFENSKTYITWVTYEYPTEYKVGKTEPMYPVNDELNNERYSKYKELANQEKNIIFGGRLAEYKYYDMHQVIESALNKVKEIHENNI